MRPSSRSGESRHPRLSRARALFKKSRQKGETRRETKRNPYYSSAFYSPPPPPLPHSVRSQLAGSSELGRSFIAPTRNLNSSESAIKAVSSAPVVDDDDPLRSISRRSGQQQHGEGVGIEKLRGESKRGKREEEGRERARVRCCHRSSGGFKETINVPPGPSVPAASSSVSLLVVFRERA